VKKKRKEIMNISILVVKGKSKCDKHETRGGTSSKKLDKKLQETNISYSI
jgi:hypothetical protein